MIPGVVFEGSTNGMLYAVSAADGKELWSFDTSADVRDREQGADARRRDRVAGAVVVDGMLFVGSGYAVGSGATAGNALLAFEVR